MQWSRFSRKSQIPIGRSFKIYSSEFIIVNIGWVGCGALTGNNSLGSHIGMDEKKNRIVWAWMKKSECENSRVFPYPSIISPAIFMQNHIYLSFVISLLGRCCCCFVSNLYESFDLFVWISSIDTYSNVAQLQLYISTLTHFTYTFYTLQKPGKSQKTRLSFSAMSISFLI